MKRFDWEGLAVVVVLLAFIGCMGFIMYSYIGLCLNVMGNHHA